MSKEVISDIQGISILILYLSGTSSILVFGTIAKKDIWLVTLLAIFFAFFIVLILARLHHIFPEKNLFDICEICFGNVLGKGLILLYAWFTLHEGTLVGINIYQFITTTSLTSTPNIIVIIPFLFLCGWAINRGIEVIGRWSNLFVKIFITFMFVSILLLIPKINIDNIRPVFSSNINMIIEGTIGVLSFPFGELIIFTIVFSNFKTKKSSYKIYISGLFIGGMIVFITSLSIVLVIGIDSASAFLYPTYATIARINVGDFLQRLEVIPAMIFILGGFLKVSIYLLATCKGFGKLFNFANYKIVIIPICLLMINLSYMLHESRLDYINWNFEIFPYYAIVFEVILPIIIWIAAEIKSKGLKTNR